MSKVVPLPNSKATRKGPPPPPPPSQIRGGKRMTIRSITEPVE
jgi:hypothetical protein